MSENTRNWLHFLTQHGARFDEGGSLRTVTFDVPEGPASSGAQSPHSPNAGFVAPLTDLGLIVATGEEAAHFLHNQLTNDVEQLGTHEARLAGYCSPKGRLLATFLMWKSGDSIYLQLPREIQPAVQKRLQMFLLRSKAKLTDASESHVLLGLSGPGVGQALKPWFADLPVQVWATVSSDAGVLIRLPDAEGDPCYEWISSLDTAEAAWPLLAAGLQPAGPQAWRLAQVRAAIPQITLPTQEQFVPQMVNFEVVGGVNFRKGCYPGQEIVARSQYLGKLKRRMLPATTEGEASAGMEVFSSADPGQPCGMIVNAESADSPDSGRRTECLVEIKTAALDSGSIHVGSATGPALQFKSLPYALPDPA